MATTTKSIYVVRNVGQGYTLHAFSSEIDARKYFIDEFVKPYFMHHGKHTADDYEIEFDPYNPETNDDWEHIFEVFEDYEIVKTPLD